MTYIVELEGMFYGVNGWTKDRNNAEQLDKETADMIAEYYGGNVR